MMKHNKRFPVKTLVSLLVAAVMLLSALPFAAAEEDPVVASGDCGADGDNVKWELTLHGILTLSGTGAMQDYAKRDDLPWRQKMVLRVIVDEGVTTIGNHAFDQMAQIYEISFSKTLTSIGDFAFYKLKELKTVVFPNKLKSIGESAFKETGLNSVWIPDSVTDIGAEAFFGCDLTSARLPNNLKSLGQGALFWNDLTEISIPNTLTKIEAKTFYANPFTNVTIPAGITSIGEYAFENCFIDTLCIFSDLKTIEHAAFFKNSSLTDIYYTGSESDWKKITIKNTGSHDDWLDNLKNNDDLKNATIHYNTPVKTVTYNANGGMGAPVPQYKFEGLDLKLTSDLPVKEGYTCFGWADSSDRNTLKYLPGAAYTENKNATLYAVWGQEAACGSLTARVSSPGDHVYYRFTPETDGSYSLLSSSGKAVTAALYDDALQKLGESESANGMMILSHELTAGKTYYLRVGYKSEDDAGFIPLTLAKSGVEIPAGATVKYSGSCSSDGSVLWMLLDDGTLIISGEGAMDDYGQYTNQAPWYASAIRTAIESVTVCEGVTHVGTYAFYNCANLLSAILPYEGIDALAAHAFENCAKLTVVVLPETLRSIGEAAFSGCRTLEIPTFPETLTSIGDSAFYGAGLPGSLILPYNLTSLGKSAFFGCDIKELLINDLLTAIPEGAFESCRSMKSVVMMTDVKTIGQNAFKGCSALADVWFGGMVEDWNAITIASGNEPLTGATLHYAGGKCGDNLKWVLGGDGTLTISGTGEMYDYKSSGTDAAPWGRDIRAVVLNPGVGSIGEYAFYHCDDLTSVTIPDSVETVGFYSFAYCAGLASLTVESGVKTIGGMAFRNTPLVDVTLGEGLETIGEYAFHQCKSLETVSLPKSLTLIDVNAFSSCTALKEVVFANGLRTIGRSAFGYCENLKSLSLPSGLETIGSYAFVNCTRLEGDVKLPGSLGTLGEGAFSGCAEITGVRVPDGVKRIEGFTFNNCSKLTAAVLPDGLEYIGNSAFNGCTALKNVVMPLSVKTVGKNAFNYAGVTDVYYSGTPADRAKITVAENNAPLETATWHYVIRLLPENVTLVWTTKMCSGKSQLPGVTVKDADGKTLTKDKDYTVSYSGDGVQPGDYTVTVTGAGDYAGSVQKTFTITEHSPHVWDEGEVTVAPTLTSEGVTTYTCTVCGVTKTEKLPVLQPETHSVKVTSGSADKTAAKKGDVVTVTAAAAPADKTFDKWVVVSGGVTLQDETKANTTFVMGDSDVEIKATYKDAPVDFLLGDVDGDGQITSSDARLALRRAVDLETYKPESREYKAADVDLDGGITSGDARMILRAAVGLEDPGDWVKA